VTREYLRSTVSLGAPAVYTVNSKILDGQKGGEGADILVKAVSLLDAHGNPLLELGTGDSFGVRVSFSARRRIHGPAFVVSIKDQYGVEVARLSTMPISGYYIESLEGDGAIELYIQDLPLLGGTYAMSVHVARANLDWIVRLEGVISFEVASRDVYKSGTAMDNSRGLIALKHRWRLLEGDETGGVNLQGVE